MKRIVSAAVVIVLAASVTYFAYAAEQEKAKSEKAATSGKQVRDGAELTAAPPGSRVGIRSRR